MRRKIPGWLAGVIIVAVLGVAVGVVWWLTGRKPPRPTEPPPFVKGMIEGPHPTKPPSAPPGGGGAHQPPTAPPGRGGR